MTLATRDMLLKEAEALMRTRGFAAFSYADLSERVGIRKASIHHHFPSKEELGAALIDTYLKAFKATLADILAENSEAPKRLARYAELFTKGLNDGMLPLCGALSAEMAALPASLQKRVRLFFDIHLDWLARVIREGVASGTLRAGLDPKATATLVLSTLEGASLVAWALKDAKIVKQAARQVMAEIEA